MEKIVDLISVPADRVAVVVGKNGEVRKKIEKLCGVKVRVDSASGDVEIDRGDAEDQLLAIKAREIIRAMAVGFSPQKAFKLLGDNIYIEIIDLAEHVREADFARVKGRIIGRQGKVRKYISKLTSTDLVILEKAVGILGNAEDVGLAKEAVLRLAAGAPHNSVFRFLEAAKK